MVIPSSSHQDRAEPGVVTAMPSNGVAIKIVSMVALSRRGRHRAVFYRDPCIHDRHHPRLSTVAPSSSVRHGPRIQRPGATIHGGTINRAPLSRRWRHRSAFAPRPAPRAPSPASLDDCAIEQHRLHLPHASLSWVGRKIVDPSHVSTAAPLSNVRYDHRLRVQRRLLRGVSTAAPLSSVCHGWRLSRRT